MDMLLLLSPSKRRPHATLASFCNKDSIVESFDNDDDDAKDDPRRFSRLLATIPLIEERMSSSERIIEG
jgi:hypothetical protein